MMSHNRWFWIRPVRWEFQVLNSKSIYFSANVTFSVCGLMTIIVPHYMKNLFQWSVSHHFTWPFNKDKEGFVQQMSCSPLAWKNEPWVYPSTLVPGIINNGRMGPAIVDTYINQSNFYSANIPGEARLSGAAAKSVFNSKIEETAPAWDCSMRKLAELT